MADPTNKIECCDEDLIAILRIGHDTSIRGTGLSLRDALSRTRYRELRPSFGELDLLSHLRERPALIKEWLLYSEDKRTDGGWYLLEDGTIGHVSTRQETRFPSIEQAVAAYVLRTRLLGEPLDQHMTARSEDKGELFILDGLRQVLQLLAAPADVALAFYPDGTVKADELALDFDNFGRASLESSELELTEAQRASLIVIDQLLDAMTASRQDTLWTDEAVRTHPKWQGVREAAGRALPEFGWPPGPDDRAARGYVF